VVRRAVLIGLSGAALLFAASAHAADQLVKVGQFSQPVYIAAPPGDGHRLFVVEQQGRIQLMVDGQKQAAPFLDMAARVTAPGGEQGLLSMALAPDYATSGKFYVYYTSKAGCSGDGCDEHVSQFTRSASNPNVADPNSEVPLLTIPHPTYSNHNGGQLQFGPDGDLYISTGDGGNEDDTQHNAQNHDGSHLLGKILRINPANPSASVPGNLAGHIYAYGLRNPWRFSFDRLTGDMIIGDVGQGQREEIDYAHPGQNAGANYGWPCFEGLIPNNDAPGGNAVQDYPECQTLAVQQTVLPVHNYPHSGGDFSGAGIIGGFVVRDPSLSDLYGRYLYGDLSTPGLRSIHLAQPTATDDRAVGVSVSSLSSFGEDAAGCIYAASVGNGGVWRIAPDTNPTPGPCPVAGTVTGTAKDTTRPNVSLMRRRHQRVLRTHSIVVGAFSNEAVTFSATATVKAGKKTLRFKRANRRAAAGQHVKFKLKLSKGTLRKLRRAMRHHRSKLARVNVTARDQSGNARTRHIFVRLVH
jgi:glucose/arabinose dehydrogenase